MSAIYLQCALHAEAKPLRAELGLRRAATPEAFPAWENEHIFLAVSGVGKMAAAVTATFHLARLQTVRAALNLGLAATSRDDALGSTLLASRVVDAGSGRAFVPDLPFRQPLALAQVFTVERIIRSRSEFPANADLVEMEASGFAFAAAAFLTPHTVHTMKIVSDRGEGERVSPADVASLVSGALPDIQTLLAILDLEGNGSEERFPPERMRLADEIASRWRLTATQSEQLKQALRRGLLQQPERADAIVTEALKREVSGKNNRAQVLQDLLNALHEDPHENQP